MQKLALRSMMRYKNISLPQNDYIESALGAVMLKRIKLSLTILSLVFFLVETASADELVFPHYNFNVTTADKNPVKLNAHTSLIVTLVPTSKDGPAIKSFAFDAKMPQHKHGMVTAPKVVKLSELQYRVDGVRLHMAGLWVFEFTVQHPTGETKVFSSFDLPSK